jgi:hypothetical protein
MNTMTSELEKIKQMLQTLAGGITTQDPVPLGEAGQLMEIDPQTGIKRKVGENDDSACKGK